MITLSEVLENLQMKDLTLLTEGAISGVQVTGVNTLESTELFMFARKGELIFITGIKFDDVEKNLLKMLDCGIESQIAGLIVNVGPYIKEIPESVKIKANQIGLPLLSLPWRVRIADVSKNMIRMLIVSEEQECKQRTLVDQVLANRIPVLDSGELNEIGFIKPSEYGMLIIELQENEIEKWQEAIKLINHRLKKRYRFFIFQQKNNFLYYILNRADIKSNVGAFSETGQKIYHLMKKEEIEIYIGMGNFYEKFSDLYQSYLEALQVVSVVKKQQNKFIFKYKNLGVYRLLLELKNTKILKNFHNELLGPLEIYDQQNHQNYLEFLKVYLEEDGKPVNVCRRLFIHRNTVIYKINKVQQILDMDLSATLDKTSLSLAFLIEDLPE